MSGTTAPRKRTSPEKRRGQNPGPLHRVLALGAAAGLLTSSAYGALPAFGAGEASPSPASGTGSSSAAPAPAASASPSPSTGASSGTGALTGLSEAALADAVQRDLKLTPQQFQAAGELGAQAAAAAVQLRQLPGYVGIRIEGAAIVVTGSGPDLEAAVAGLAVSVKGLSLEAPAAGPAAEAPAAAPPSSTAPSVAPPPQATTPASAEGNRSQLAVSTDRLFQEYVRDVGPQGLQAVMSAGGKFVIRTGGINTPESLSSSSRAGAGTASAASGKVTPAQFVSRYANVELDGGTPLKPEADVPGGVGYQTDIGFICSTGFSAFDPTGLPAVLTAGHCASDGEAKTATLEFQGTPAGLLGKFGFSQFGGPGNSRVVENPLDPSNPGNVGTDISVIQSLRQDIDPLPAASTWGDPSVPGPDVKIIGTADPVAGMPVCRSGRTSAWSCGTVDAVGIFIVPGPAFATGPTDLRAYNGFLSYGVQSSGGDSGGPYISGNYAVGTHAAGDTPDENGNVIQNFAVGATLRDSLAVLPGYQLELFLNKPAVTTPAAGGTYQPGQTITGSVPAAPASAVAEGSKVRITIQGKDPFEVAVDPAGNWSFTAPQGTDTLRFTARTVNGFSTSGANSFEFASAAAEPPAPPAPTDPVPTAPPTSPAPTTPTSPAPTEPAPTSPAPAPPAEAPAVVIPPASTPTPTVPPADLANTGGNRNNPGDAGDLAYTGSAGLVAPAIAAAAALAVGLLLMVLVRRRKGRSIN
ncbi:streptogrisin C [Pseudarthrobacter defluvii]|uniref:S1 family peptidase n=1 Tax=Pseudarthrobacter defluvii TaxID=410837 RepID=UPI00277F2AD2|nr:S1 family peptidase [Pseudarthrobacter defluvii]MDQ0767832.1 streptogrisin C [Pseudarthrobacter defluvii]